MKNFIQLFTFAVFALVASAFSFGVEYTPIVATGLGVASFALPSAESGVLMMSLPLQQSRALFTKMTVEVWKEKITPQMFLRSFFTEKESLSKQISIEVRRGTERVAVDVERSSNGNRNTFSKSTEKIFVPPYYYEYLTANDHRLYDVAIGMNHETGFAQLTQELAEDLLELQYKIERAYEKQCAEVLETGIVQLQSGTNIDFKRKAASLVDVSGSNPWTTGGNNPITDIKNGCDFLRQTGKMSGGIVNMIAGDEALEALLNNDTFQARSDIKDFDLAAMKLPQVEAVGGVFHGVLSAGSYSVRVWSYPEVYEDSNGNVQSYINPKKIVLLPAKTNFVLSYAAVPQLIDGNSVPQQGAYLVQEFFDDRKTAHEISIKSAGVAIPVAVDQIYTAQVVA